MPIWFLFTKSYPHSHQTSILFNCLHCCRDIRRLVVFSPKHLRCLGSRLVAATRGSDTEETDLRTVLLHHANWSCWGAAAGERDCGDESADAAAAMLFGAVGVQLLGNETAETAETNLRTVLYPAIWSCWGAAAGERDCGDESADGAATMLFGAVGAQLDLNFTKYCTCPKSNS